MEKIYFFLNSFTGMYITQSVIHSAVAAVLADISIVAWGVRSPVRRQSLRIGVILIPIIAFPLYQAINPDRGGIYFRNEALLDSWGWLLMKLWGHVPVMVFIIIVLGLTVLVFLLQEFLPIVRHTAESAVRGGGRGEGDNLEDSDIPERYSAHIRRALEDLPGDSPEVVVMEDDDLVVFSSTGRVPSVYVSTGLVDALDNEQLRGAIAHEIAHIRRTRRPVLTFLFVFRMLMFFNPIALFEFRRAVQDEEEICDDEAVSATGDPAALSGALGKFLEGDVPSQAAEGTVGRIEDYSQDMLIKKRIQRLSGPAGEAADTSGRMSLAVFVVSTVAVNYFIV